MPLAATVLVLLLGAVLVIPSVYADDRSHEKGEKNSDGNGDDNDVDTHPDNAVYGYGLPARHE